LIKVLRQKTSAQLSRLMGISDSLAGLNAARFDAWSPQFTSANAKQAILAFNGDVYDSLEARSLRREDLDWSQQHLCILSGLYGVLRPLDWMQPYRLEMGTALQVGTAANLYQYWKPRIAPHLNARLAADATPVVVNLASEEYAKSLDRKLLKARVIDCVFEDWKDGRFKVIGFFAKKARGLMARHVVTRRVNTPGKLRSFDLAGYGFDAAVSRPERLVFRRRVAP
jgi:cytoplasmic iron level regulating protein YaaA (DUF328/UPF0246 family)